MSRRSFYQKMLLLLCAAAWTGHARADVQVPLPPLAQVTAQDGSGATWRQSGELKGTVEGACSEFQQVLAARGWRVKHMIATGRQTSRRRLLVCCRQRQRVLVMVWEKEAGTCGFAWGAESTARSEG